MISKVVLKSSVLFLLIFIFLIITLGTFNKPLPDNGLSLAVVVLFGLTFLIFTWDAVNNKISFIPNSKILKIEFLLLALSISLISIIRDGFLNSYLYSLILTFTSVIVMIQFLYRIPVNKALNLFLLTLFIVLITNLVVQYVNTGSLKLDISTQREQRLLGFLGGGLAGVMAGLSAILSVICYFLSRSKLPVFIMISLALSWLVLLMSDNRTAIIACSIASILVFLNVSKFGKVYKSIFILVILVFYLFFNFYLQQSIGGKNLSRDFDRRTIIWGYAKAEMLKEPILGYGKHNPFLSNSEALRKFGNNLADPHNAYLYFVLRNGLIVSTLFFLFLISFILVSYKTIRDTHFSLFISIPVYWIIVSLSGGDYFNFKLNFGSIVFGISLFGFLDHPDLRMLDHEEENGGS